MTRVHLVGKRAAAARSRRRPWRAGCVAAAATLVAMVIAEARATPRQVAERWALLIGVDDYANATTLRYCGADQRSLQARLAKAGFADDHVFLMHDEAEESRYRPSQRNIEKQLDLVLRLAGEDAMVLVAFSGHGVSLDGHSYLCPNDGTLDDPETLVSLDVLYERLQRCSAAFKLVLVDACRNDPRRGGQRTFAATRGTEALARGLQEGRLPEGVVLLNSCAPGEISYEEPELGHGVFMHYVLEGLVGGADANADGAVSLNELQRFAGTRTKAHVAKRFNESQRPFFRGDLSSEALEYALLPVSPGGPSHDPAAIQAVIDEALAAARAIPDAQSRCGTLRGIGRVQEAIGNRKAAQQTIAEALAAARAIPDARRRCEELRYIGSCQKRMGDLAAAQQTVADLFSSVLAVEEKDRDDEFLRIAAAAHEIGDSVSANRALSEARAIVRREEEFVRAVSLSWVARDAAEIGNAAVATEMFDEAKAVARRTPMPGLTLAEIAGTQAGAGMEAAGRATLEEARRYGGESSTQFNAMFLGQLACWHAQQGDLKAAYEAARSIGDLTLFYAQRAFADIAEAQAKKGDLAGALSTARWLTDAEYRSRALYDIAIAKADRGDVSGAQALLPDIQEGFLRSSALAAVCRAQLTQGDGKAALLSARSITYASRLGFFTRIAVLFEEQGNPAARNLFDETLQTMNSMPQNEYDSAVSAVAGAFAEAGRVDKGLEVARGAKAIVAKAGALWAVAAGLQQRSTKAAAALPARPALTTAGE